MTSRRLSSLAHAASTSLDAFAAVCDDVKIDPMRASLDPVLAAARANAHETLRLFADALYERGQVMLADEVNRLRVCVANGVVAGAWALRVVAIAAEVGDGNV